MRDYPATSGNIRQHSHGCGAQGCCGLQWVAWCWDSLPEFPLRTPVAFTALTYQDCLYAADTSFLHILDFGVFLGLQATENLLENQKTHKVCGTGKDIQRAMPGVQRRQLEDTGVQLQYYYFRPGGS